MVLIPKILHVPESLDQKHFTLYERRGFSSNKQALAVAYHPLSDAPSRSVIEADALCVSGVYIDTLTNITRETAPDLETIRTVARGQGRKWAINSKHKYFTRESFGDGINRTAVLT